MSNPIVISIEGIISAGKTCLIEECLIPLWTKQGIRVTLIKEPVDKWNEILPLFCEDPSRWGYHFQTKAFHDRVKESRVMWNKYKDVTDIFLTERSPLSDPLFIDTLEEQNLITRMEKEHYQEWYGLWSEVMPFIPNLFIYLTPTVDEAMKRKALRNRPGEEKITPEYQEILKKHHDNKFNGKVIHNNKEIKVFAMNSSLNYKSDEVIKHQVAEEILSYVNTCR